MEFFKNWYYDSKRSVSFAGVNSQVLGVLLADGTALMSNSSQSIQESL